MSGNGQRIAVIAVVLAVIATIGWFKLGDQAQVRRYNWYYDLNTGELFKPAEYGDLPQAAPSGAMRGTSNAAAGVPALVVRIDGKTSVLYLQTRNPALKPDAIPGPKDIWVSSVPAEPGTPPVWSDCASTNGKRIIEEAQASLRGKEWDVDFP
jgi:hypothetical protein